MIKDRNTFSLWLRFLLANFVFMVFELVIWFTKQPNYWPAMLAVILSVMLMVINTDSSHATLMGILFCTAVFSLPWLAGVGTPIQVLPFFMVGAAVLAGWLALSWQEIKLQPPKK